MAGRISQAAAVSLESPTNETGRISQAAALSIEFPTNELGRISQAAALSIEFPTNETARLSQIVVLVIEQAGGHVNPFNGGSPILTGPLSPALSRSLSGRSNRKLKPL